jgi:Protein of unknown function (DUF4232)
MTKGQFALLTAALGLTVMGGAGYVAYANTSPSSHGTAPSNGAAATQQQTGANGGSVPVQSSGAGKEGSTAAVPQCVNGNIQVTEADGQGAAGTLSMLLVFRNVSGHRCSLYGYPGASIVGPGGEDLLDAKRVRGGLATMPTVTLDAGERASTLLEWSDVPSGTGSGGCQVQGAANLAVTPPNFTQSTTFSLGAGTEICSAFEIHPVVKGATGQ